MQKTYALHGEVSGLQLFDEGAQFITVARYSSMAQGRMHQHTLAATYLKGFLSPETRPGHQPSLWVHNLARDSWKARAPSNVSKLPNYYSVEGDDGKLRHDAERALGVLETKITPILRDLLPEQRELDPEQQLDLAMFAGTTLWRVPHVHEAVRPSMEARMRQAFARQWVFVQSEPELLAEWRRLFSDTLGPCGSLEELMGVVLDPTKIRIVPERHIIVGHCLQRGIATARALMQMGWRILVAPPSTCFVTSDKPGGVLHPLPGLSSVGHNALVAESMLMLPLTSSRALLAAPWMEQRGYEDASADDVEMMNGVTVEEANHVVAPSTAFLGDAYLSIWRERARKVARGEPVVPVPVPDAEFSNLLRQHFGIQG